MRCGKWEKRISDALDGALSVKQASRLERHLRGCASCRTYKEDLARLHGRTMGLADPGMSRGDWSDFSRRLESRLAAISPRRPRVSLSRWFRWKPAWALAGLALVATAGAYLIFFHFGGRGEETFFSLEDPAGQIIGEIGPNADLENSFNREIMASINESAGILADGPAARQGAEEALVSFGDNPMFWESLSEEELVFIESELRKERGLGGLT